MSGNPVLTPNPGFCLPDAAVDVINEKLIVNTGYFPPDLNIDFSIEKFIITASLFIIKSCEDPEYPPVFFQNKSVKTVFSNSLPLQLTINLNSDGIIIRDEFYVYKSWSVLITLDENDNPVHYSELLPWPT